MNKLFIVMYHYTRDLKHSRYPNIRGLDAGLFREQIAFLSSNFNVITMEQVLDAISGVHKMPEKAVLLTFDDGYTDNYTVAMPVLEDYGLQGSFFIPGKTFTEHKLLDVNKIHYILASGDIISICNSLRSRMDHYRGNEWDYRKTDDLYNEYAVPSRYDDKDTVFVKQMLQTVLPEGIRNIISSELFKEYVEISEEVLAYELYMTEEQIKTLKRHGMYIGIHGYDHYWLGELEPDQMKKDIDAALDVMGGFLDRNCWVMNYPYGSYNEEVLEYIKEKGAKIGLTTEVRAADIMSDDLLLLPRLDCNDFPPKSKNYIDYI